MGPLYALIHEYEISPASFPSPVNRGPPLSPQKKEAGLFCVIKGFLSTAQKQQQNLFHPIHAAMAT